MKLATPALVVLACAGLAACVDARNPDPSFGQAFNQHIASQIADPDAQYVGDPAPGSNGNRVGLAQERYRTGKVIKPVPATASKIGSVSMGASNSE
jgi:hypothetical protein